MDVQKRPSSAKFRPSDTRFPCVCLACSTLWAATLLEQRAVELPCLMKVAGRQEQSASQVAMLHSSDLADRPLGEVIEAIGSAEVSPGAGAAGAVGLALLRRALAKRRQSRWKHRPDDAALGKLRSELSDIVRRALRGADEDASQFETFIRERDAQAAENLLQVGAGLMRAARALTDLLSELADRVDPAVRADGTAAQALCDAFSEIETKNLEQNREAAVRTAGSHSSDPA
jgi:formiminotetrahydrofolate cyclodeaminase